MPAFQAKLPTGYHEQTYNSPYWIVRWPHQKRLQAAVAALFEQRPARVLDYGAGEGDVLIAALDAGFEADEIVAYEPVEKFWRKLEARLEESGYADRVTVVKDYTEVNGPFDLILCLGVLEHMPLPERFSFYRLCDETLAGRAVIDVPVEAGPALSLKAVARRVLKGREREYTVPQLVKYGMGAVMYDPERFRPDDDRTWINDHRGFDYRLLRRELAARFEVTRCRRTPVGWLPALLNQEVFLTIAKR